MSKQLLNQMVAIINRTRVVGRGNFNGSMDQVKVFIVMANRAGLSVKAPTACTDIKGMYCVEVAV
jgi:hypothetical protein